MARKRKGRTMSTKAEQRKAVWTGAARLTGGMATQLACMMAAAGATESWDASTGTWVAAGVAAAVVSTGLAVLTWRALDRTAEVPAGDEQLGAGTTAAALACATAGTGIAAVTFLLQAAA